MSEIKKRAAKLIDVKSIVTLCLTIVFCVLSLIGVVSQEFLAIYTMIIGFYFGTQATKKSEGADVKYIGPQHGETVQVNAELIQDAAMDEAVQNDVHPPDVVVEGFAG